MKFMKKKIDWLQQLGFMIGRNYGIDFEELDIC